MLKGTPLFVDILNCADMKVDKYGNDLGFAKSVDDIKSRYCADSIVYSRCQKMVEYFKSKNLIPDLEEKENERD